MSLHLEWTDEMLSVIETATIALRGLPSEEKLGAAVSVLKTRLYRLEKHRYDLAALRAVVENYIRSQPGGMHDHFEQEVEQLCKDWVGRNPNSFIWANTEAREGISRELAAYKRRYPFKSTPPG